MSLRASIRLITGMLLIALLAAALPALAQGGVMVQAGNNLNLRGAPNTSGAVLATVPFETTLPASAISGDRQWVVVNYNGQNGWLALAYVGVTQGSLGDLPVSNETFSAGGGGGGPTSAVQIAGTVNLRLRSGPSTGDRVIGAIPYQTPVPALALSEDGAWVQTSYQGLTGWVAREYVTVVAGSLDNLTGQPPAAPGAPAGPANHGVFVAIEGTQSPHGWNNFVPAEWRAGSAATARMVAYISESRNAVETCTYTGGGRTATLTRFRIDYNFRLVDVATGQQIDGRGVGNDPPGCPDSRTFYSLNESIEGRPNWEQVWPWLAERLLGLGDAPGAPISAPAGSVPASSGGGAGLNPAANPAYGTVNLAAGFGDPAAYNVRSGGGADLNALGGLCRGYSTGQPTYRINYTAGGANLLRFYFISDGDGTLAVQAPNGTWSCNDDSYGSLDPSVDFYGPASGTYNVLVGSYSSGQAWGGTLYVTAQDGLHP